MWLINLFVTSSALPTKDFLGGLDNWTGGTPANNRANNYLGKLSKMVRRDRSLLSENNNCVGRGEESGVAFIMGSVSVSLDVGGVLGTSYPTIGGGLNDRGASAIIPSRGLALIVGSVETVLETLKDRYELVFFPADSR